MKRACFKLIYPMLGLAALYTNCAIAQLGSVGGSIGKRDKAATGQSDGGVSPQLKERPKRAVKKTGTPEQRAGCGNFFGVWTSGGGSWLYGADDTVFSRNGTAKHSSGIKGSWSCKDGEIVLNWLNWDQDRLVLSADGKRLNSVVGGRGFSR